MTIRTLFALSILAGGVAANANAASTVVVNSTDDTVSDDGVCTLREALNAVNAQASGNGCTFSGSGSPTTVQFALPLISDVNVITVGSQLPELDQPAIIDGLSQSGADCTAWPPALLVEVTSTNGQFNGFTLNAGASGSTIRGLVINGFNNNQGYAFNFNAAINIYQGGNNHVECNLIGTDAFGTTAVPNLRAVDINSSSNNVIGSDGVAGPYVKRNLLSGNAYEQVDTRGNALSGNRISGNYIGTDATGTVAIAGGSSGVDISANPGPASGNFVGWDGVGDPALMRNIVSGFSGTGGAITMVVGAIGNQVAGNYIGTDASGTVAIPNGIGIELGSNSSVYHNIIGNDGTQNTLSARNVISGSTIYGVQINGFNGTHDNAVIGNYFGLNAAGTASIPNGVAGLQMVTGNANSLVARNWFAGQGTSIYMFGTGSGSTASFINNSGGTIADLPALDSSGNCMLDPTGVQVYAQGSSVPNPNLFAGNWWGVSTGPNTAGGASADGSIQATPFLTAPADICSDVIFRNGFDSN
jgi:CSLREA domain-containing protein